MIGHTISHYRVLEMIGAGGMGKVYRAHDEQLDRDVALKVLPAGMLADEAARRQFRAEALALAKLNHPNIETVFEFSTQDDVDFLAMELIAGYALSDKLKDGPLTQPDLLRLGLQLAEGLSAAHNQGIIHRDLKPGNLFVTPDGRLKILDFGLAKLIHSNLPDDITQSAAFEEGEVTGTVPYMSPEQLRGLPVDPRSDIYAAGAVLYEMATGKRPFPQQQVAELIGAILHESPESPTLSNPHVSPGLERTILKSLEKSPSQRYQTARELQAALEGVSGGDTSTATVPKNRWKSFWLVAIALFFVAIAGLVLEFDVGGIRDRLFQRKLASNTGAHSENMSSVNVRRSVAVLGFRNLSGRTDEAWLSTALSEMLTTELAAGGALRTVPGESVAQMKVDLALPDAESYGHDTLSKIRQSLHTDTIVFGSYVPLGQGQIRLDVRLQDAAGGETLAYLSEKGEEQEIDDLVSQAGAELRSKLGVSPVTQAQAASIRAAVPSNPEAARLYSEGLTKLRVFDALGARDLLEKAVAVDPSYAPAHSVLAEAWSTLGYDAKAKQEAKRAFELSENLSREDRLMIEGRYRETVSQWDKAAEIYRTLWNFFPDNLDYGLRLAGVQTSASRGQEALDTIDQLRKVSGPASEDSRIDIAEAEAANSIGDFKHDAAAAAKAAEKGRALGARLLVARSQRLQCWALHKLGRRQESEDCCEESKRIFAEAGDRDGVASVLVTTAAVFHEQGELGLAQSRYEEALVIQRNTGDLGGVAVILNNLSNVYVARGNYAVAKKMYQESVRISQEIGDKDGVVLALGNLAGLLANEGDDLRRTRGMYEELLAICREMGSKDRTALQLSNIGEILYWQGDLGGAERALEEALALNSQSGEKRQSGYDLAYLADVLQAQGNLTQARSKREQTLKLRNELGDQGDAADTRIALADLSIEEGHAKEAVAPVRQAISELSALNLIDDEAWAYPILARALLSAGEPGEALKVLDSGASIAAKSHIRIVHFAFAIVEARVIAATGKPAEAAEKLRATVAEATKYGFVGYEFEARLALGEIEMKSGNTAAGRARLAVLEKEATAKGFLLIARKAHAATGQ
jgi:serine/threonine protein kinase/tetratricopeptide (TPR) repeat protein